MFKRNILLLTTTMFILSSFTSCDSSILMQPIMNGNYTDNIITHVPPEDTQLFNEQIEEFIVNEFVEQVVKENTEEVAEEIIEEPEIQEEITEEPETQEEIIEEHEIQEEVIEEPQIQEEIIEEPVIQQEVEQFVYEQPTTQSTTSFTLKTSIPWNEPVDNSYFEDALFIGDSILKGFKAFVSPYPNNVIAEQNAGLDQIYSNKDIYYTDPNNKDTLWNAINTFIPNPEKIYVLIGVNGIPGLENDKSMFYYEDLIIKLKERFPNKNLYVCAVTPLTKELSDKRAPSFSSEKLDDFNNQLFDLCQNHNVHYLQTDENLRDLDGRLLPQYDAGDGMHLNKAGHTVLFDYFKSHVYQL